MRSRLDDVQGIGPTRRKRLLKTFGSVAGIRQATEDELRQQVGTVLAERIRAALGEEETEQPQQAGEPK
jgi:excinuclease ABC subunit C